MKAIDIPDLFPKYWGLDADPGDINDIPENSTGVDGRACLDIGFPHECTIPLGAGGVPPFGQDFNGIYRQITRTIQWASNAGAPFVYDSAFSTAIGGYPKGAVLQTASNPGWYWISTADDNTSDPDSGGSNWKLFSPTSLYAVDSGTKNAGVIALIPPPPSSASMRGMAMIVKKMATANDAPYTLNFGFGATPVINTDGSAVNAGALPGNSIFTVVLDPNDNLQLQNVSSGSVGRVRFTGNTTFYVSTTGSDSNNGTAIGTPWLTLQHAWDTLLSSYDLNGFNATIQCADGTYSAGVNASGRPVGATEAASILFHSASGNPAACIINASADCFSADTFAAFQVSGFKTITSGLYCIKASQGEIEYGNMNFGTCTEAHVHADDGGRAAAISNYTISGAAANHFEAGFCAVIRAQGVVITVVGTPAFSEEFAQAQNAGVLFVPFGSTSFSGSATGKRYAVSENAVIQTVGGGATFFPGSVGGTTTTGGQYV